ncbi:DUF2867 domain-containing protein, partial [Candidatus Marinamargulisbacteria bacterium SCGC AAA071-K20]
TFIEDKVYYSLPNFPFINIFLSSYWLYFVTATSYTLVKNLVDSMSVEVVCKQNSLAEDLQIKLIHYEKSIHIAFDKIDQNEVVSSWKDALNSNLLKKGLSSYIQIPQYGCFKDYRKTVVISQNDSIGRRSLIDIKAGDTLDFWRVLYADKDEGRLLLYAEMKLPGEAWLEFFIKDNMLHQHATFRPLGVLGRVYWWVISPFHNFLFEGMLKKLASKSS